MAPRGWRWEMKVFEWRRSSRTGNFRQLWCAVLTRHEPGWDFFELWGSFASSISIRRSFPIRLVRVYSQWPSSDVLATALHPAGLQELQLELPQASRHLTKWIVAVCPSTLALRGEMASSPRMPLTAAAAAVQAAQGELEASDLERRVGQLSGYLRRHKSTSPSSDSTTSGSQSPRHPRHGAVEILEQLYEEEVLSALRSGKPSDQCLEEVTGVRARDDEIATLKKELEQERHARAAAEASWRQECDATLQLREQYGKLQQQLRNAERDRMTSEMQVRQLSADLQHARAVALDEPATLEDVISSMVSLEVKQLQTLNPEERQLAKRRLLLRWHPDKNAGTGAGNDLAKRVMQGLHVHPEWNQGTALP
ncbi:unnamed protein product [Cladocopium goreaui]|uniref:J domain-containing protein n=1 Tax=Cladocopium goreaui TaxID=2562237 RepID=A0A9P1CLG9_9DINO|nr:unnamed protein product [Cladocopium goreaui]